jgi:hypothetical protein
LASRDDIIKEKESREMNKGQQIKVELREPESEGIYSNWVMITYSPSEFIIDFGRILPGLAKTRVYSRIVMTPQHVKRLLNVLEKNISTYEEKFGEIKPLGNEERQKGIGF